MSQPVSAESCFPARPVVTRDGGSVRRSLMVMAAVVTTIGLIAALYWLRSLFIPIAFGVVLTLILTPLTQWLQRLGMGRTAAVVLVVILVIGGAAALFATAGYQLGHLLVDLPKNFENLRVKAASLRSLSAGSQVKQLDSLWKRLNAEATAPDNAAPDEVPATAEETKEAERVVVEEESTWSTALWEWGEPLLEPVTLLAFAGVLAIFMLLAREDLRNRLLRLMGEGHLTVTTKAVDEATNRISRFLLMQALMNVAYGIVLAVIMVLFGLEYALLAGCLAAVLRYIPFVGGFVAAVFPILLALAQYSSWWPAVGMIATLICIEIIVSNVLEPWLFGKSMGVSVVAYLVGAAFWTFLWGGIGLVMSGPLTVCLAVIGKYVPQLFFLNVLLGDEPVLERPIGFYQRLVARDLDEAVDLAQAEYRETSLDGVYEKLLQPALCQLRQDVERNRLSEEDAEAITLAMDELAEQLQLEAGTVEPEASTDEEPGESSLATEAVQARLNQDLRLMCVSARDSLDGAPLRLVSRVLSAEGWRMELLDRPVMTSDIVASIADDPPHALCLGVVPPGGETHLRFILKRIRDQFPDLKIFVCRLQCLSNPTPKEIGEGDSQLLISASIPQLLRDLRSWHSVLASQSQAVEPAAQTA